MQVGDAMVKLIMSWNIKTDEEPAYFEFMVQEFAPRITKMGTRPSEAWYTVYGEGPQIITVVEAPDRAVLNKALESDEWSDLLEKLNAFVTDYKQKIINVPNKNKPKDEAGS
jgi:hypothetical protein